MDRTRTRRWAKVVEASLAILDRMSFVEERELRIVPKEIDKDG